MDDRLQHLQEVKKSGGAAAAERAGVAAADGKSEDLQPLKGAAKRLLDQQVCLAAVSTPPPLPAN